MIPVLLDTDIGTDIDDALALVLAAKSPGLAIKAVTTVTGNTPARARIAMHLLRLCGQGGIPVAAGRPAPWQAKTAHEQPLPPQYMPGDMDGYAPATDAVQLILDTVRQNPGLHIITLAPLTNIAACIAAEPALMRTARLTVMGGMVGAAFQEGNIATDPEAARTVFASGVPINLVSLDVTTGLELTDDMARMLLADGTGLSRCLAYMVRRWKGEVLADILRDWGEEVEGDDYPAALGMHDPIAVAAVLWPELFTFAKAHILVETEGAVSRGLTLAQVNPFRGNKPTGKNVNLATRIDGKALMQRFLAQMQSGAEKPTELKNTGVPL